MVLTSILDPTNISSVKTTWKLLLIISYIFLTLLQIYESSSTFNHNITPLAFSLLFTNKNNLGFSLFLFTIFLNFISSSLHIFTYSFLVVLHSSHALKLYLLTLFHALFLFRLTSYLALNHPFQTNQEFWYTGCICIPILSLYTFIGTSYFHVIFCYPPHFPPITVMFPKYSLKASKSARCN